MIYKIINSGAQKVPVLNLTTMQNLKTKFQNIGFGTILKIGLIILIGVVIYTIYKKLMALFTTDKKAIQEDFEQTQIVIPSLPKPLTYYQNLADRQAQKMHDIGNSFTDTDLKDLAALNKFELQQVFKSFGTREHKNFGITTFTGNLFDWYDHELYRFNWLGDKSQYQKFKEVWQKSELW